MLSNCGAGEDSWESLGKQGDQTSQSFFKIYIYIFFFLITFFAIHQHIYIYFNWRLITLQYCSGFCHTLTWVSHGCTYVPHSEPPSHLPPHPIPSQRVSQCTSPEHPVSCTEPGLVIYFTYGNIHVSMLFSQIMPHSPSPTESKSLSFICVSFAVSHIGSLLPSF